MTAEIELVGGPCNGMKVEFGEVAPASILVDVQGEDEGLVARYRYKPGTKTKPGTYRFKEMDRVRATIPMPGGD